MGKREISLGQLFIQEIIRALSWGIVVIIAVAVIFIGGQQQIKEGIEYGIDTFMTSAVIHGTHPYFIGKAKQLVKEGIEYGLTKSSGKIKIVVQLEDRTSGE